MKLKMSKIINKFKNYFNYFLGKNKNIYTNKK